ncbi:MAG: hydrogenase maturation protease [Nitrosomonadales bacterium]|nr:hydrogenase maturation protease [Nitrosomonadales bacterium]
MTAPILIFATGNESRGDDALAPLLLRRLDAWLRSEGRAGDFELIEDFQLQIEHVMDMAGRELVLLVDAGMDTPAPHTFYRVRVDASRNLYSHALTPEALLAVYPQVCREVLPPVFALCIRGEQFELGAALSPAAESRLETAMEFARGLLRDAAVASWEMRAQHQAYPAHAS